MNENFTKISRVIFVSAVIIVIISVSIFIWMFFTGFYSSRVKSDVKQLKFNSQRIEESVISVKERQSENEAIIQRTTNNIKSAQIESSINNETIRNIRNELFKANTATSGQSDRTDDFKTVYERSTKRIELIEEFIKRLQ